MLQRKPRFVHSSTSQLYEYWNRQRGSRPAPERAQIEPSDIRNILPDTFILTVDDNGRFTWRLAGTRVSSLHCRELKERNFLSDWVGQERETIDALLHAVIEEAAVTVLQFQGSVGRGQPLDMEMVLMPLSIYGRANGRVLGAVVALNEPYWLGIQPPLDRKIGNTRLLWPSGPPHSLLGEVPPLTSPHDRFARFTTPAVEVSQARARRYRHLTVMDGGKS